MPGQLSGRVVRVVAASAAGLAVGVGVGCLAAPASAASAAPIDHCATYAVASPDPNGFPGASQTAFVADCLNHRGYDVAQRETGPKATVGLGAAGSWAAPVRQAGLGVSTTPATGRLIEVAAGRTSVVTGAGGVPEDLDGPFLGVVVAVSGSLPTFRVYDVASHQVDEWQLTYANSGSPAYLDLTGGHRYVAPAPARTTAATPAPTSSAAVAGPTTVPPSITAPAASPTTTAPPPTVADPEQTTVAPYPTGDPTTSEPATPDLSTRASSVDEHARNVRYAVAVPVAALLVLVVALLGRVLVNRHRPR